MNKIPSSFVTLLLSITLIGTFCTSTISVHSQDIQLFPMKSRSQPIPFTGNPALALLNWNDDQYPDLLGLFRGATVNQSLSLGIMINDGEAGFQEALHIGEFRDWINLMNAELDGKPGNEIIAMTTSTIFQIEIGSDLSVTTFEPIFTGENITSALAFDVDGDGTTDSVTITFANSIFRSYQLNRDTMLLQNERELSESNWSSHPRFRQSEHGNDVAVLEDVRNDVGGLKWKNLSTGETSSSGPRKVNPYVWDLNGDGIDDFIGVNFSHIWFFNGLSGGGFDTSKDVIIDHNVTNIVKRNFPKGGRTVSGDINGNGVNETIRIVDSFVHPWSAPVSLKISLGRRSYEFDLGRNDGFGNLLFLYDFNHDSHLDILYCSSGGPRLVLFGKGDGFFQDPIPSGGTFYGDYRIHNEMADFNNDGLPDLFIT